jgi:hypothetical protein
MTVLIGLLVGLAGMALLIIGLGFFAVFRLALRHFDQALKAELAAQGRDHVERAAMKIQNPLVRRFVLDTWSRQAARSRYLWCAVRSNHASGPPCIWRSLVQLR